MHTPLDALLTETYVLIDDFLPPSRPRCGRRPKITDSALITLLIAQSFLGVPDDRRFLQVARRRLAHLFPYLPKQSGFEKLAREK